MEYFHETPLVGTFVERMVCCFGSMNYMPLVKFNVKLGCCYLYALRKCQCDVNFVQNFKIKKMCLTASSRVQLLQ